MDPKANLYQQLELARAIVADDSLADESDPTEHNPDAYAEHVRATELAEHVQALDEWITKGGFLPEQWERTRNVVPKQLQGEALLRLIEQRGTPTVVRQNEPTDWMMANYVLVTFADGFECGIAPDGRVSS